MEKRFFHAKEDPARVRVNSVDPVFLILVLVLLALGLTMLWSASFPQSEYDSNYTESTRYLYKQALCAALGLGCMAAFSRVPAELWRRAAWHIYCISIALLLAVLVVGQSVNGAKRWVFVLNDAPYAAIHRVASAGKRKGVLQECLDYCSAKHQNLRIDTHFDNKIMQHLLEKYGFHRCGTIYLENGDPRIAYQLIK